MSLVAWIYALHIACSILFSCGFFLSTKKCKASLAKSKCMTYFFWNGFIRLFMETFLELALAAIINIRTADWQTSFPSVKYSIALALISLVLIGLFFPVLIILYCRSFSVLGEARFKKKYGAGLEEISLIKKVSPKSILAYPVIFFGRRLVFALSAVYLEDFLWGQLAIQMMISVSIVLYLKTFKPLDSPFSNRMEVLNECTVIFLVYFLMLFTDFVPDPENRNKIGRYYVRVNILHMIFHLVFLFLATCYKLKLVCKRYRCFLL